jgi:hypothetical protein
VNTLPRRCTTSGVTGLPEDPDWIGIGYFVADIGFVFLVIASLAGWFALRRGATTGIRVAAVIVACSWSPT